MQDLREPWGLQDLQDLLELQELLDPQDRLDLAAQDLLGHQERQDLVLLVQPELLDLQDLLVRSD